MVDPDVILAKASAFKRHLKRIKEKRNTDLDSFLNDLDRQESVLFNLQMAIQNCIDIASHLVSEEGLGVPGSTNEMFYLLEERGHLDGEITERMVKAVGFRNLIVHEYAKIDLKQVHEIAHKNIKDIEAFLTKILVKLDLQML